MSILLALTRMILICHIFFVRAYLNTLCMLVVSISYFEYRYFIAIIAAPISHMESKSIMIISYVIDRTWH